MSTRVYVTGIGLITAIGDSVGENLKAMSSGMTRLGKTSHIDTANKDLFPVCEIRHDNTILTQLAELGNSGEISRTALLGLIAAKEAVKIAGLSESERESCGLISANSVGGMDRSELFYPHFLTSPTSGKLSGVKGHTCGYSTELIAEHLGLGGFSSTISTACSSSANAIMFGTRLLKSGKLNRVVAGGCDALTRFTINGFASLKILDSQGCKPFDANRAGLNLGEGAGFLVLESEQSVLERKGEPICEVSGYGNTCDAYHQTASSPDGEGSYQAMMSALKVAGLDPEDIDYINAHGTGTNNNDLSEGIAIERVFSSAIPPVSSTKPFTGHTLGAAGGVEAVLCALSIRDGILYPNLRWETPMEELNFKPLEKFQQGLTIKHVLSNSFGFGGNDTSLVLSQC